MQAVDDALGLLSNERRYERRHEIEEIGSLSDLLNQARELSAPAEPEPIRTIHHFACTGGTLITKCLASMPNAQVLSEVDPLSVLNDSSGRRFFPTDLIKLARLSTRGADEQLLKEIFIEGLRVIHGNASRNGQRLIVRDHTHSHFCVGSEVPERPTVLSLIRETFPCVSAILVRHPVDSFLSLHANGWIHFQPDTLDEYCRRYMKFLDLYPGVSVVRYEDFVSNPRTVMEGMCGELKIPYSSQFIDTFSVYQVSGDSGRSGDILEPRPRRMVPPDVEAQIYESEFLRKLCGRLGFREF
jgi:hypothetical protein